METVRSVLYTVYFDVFFFQPFFLRIYPACTQDTVLYYGWNLLCFFPAPLYFNAFFCTFPFFLCMFRFIVYVYVYINIFLYAHILLSFECFSLIFSIQFGSLWLNSRLLLSYFFSVLENRRNYAHHRNVFIFICIYRIWFHCVLKTIQSGRYMQKWKRKQTIERKKSQGNGEIDGEKNEFL